MTVRRVAIESKFMREIDGINSVLSEKDQRISTLSDLTIASIDRVFEMAMELDEVHRELLLHRIVQLMPERMGSLARAIMGFMPKDQVLAVSKEVIVQRPEVSGCSPRAPVFHTPSHAHHAVGFSFPLPPPPHPPPTHTPTHPPAPSVSRPRSPWRTWFGSSWASCAARRSAPRC